MDDTDTSTDTSDERDDLPPAAHDPEMAALLARLSDSDRALVLEELRHPTPVDEDDCFTGADGEPFALDVSAFDGGEESASDGTSDDVGDADAGNEGSC